MYKDHDWGTPSNESQGFYLPKPVTPGLGSGRQVQTKSYEGQQKVLVWILSKETNP